MLAVSDVDRTLGWYEDHLGLEPLRVDEWRKGDAPFPSLRVNESMIIDVIIGPRAGENVDHICLLVDIDDLEVVVIGEVRRRGRPEPVLGRAWVRARRVRARTGRKRPRATPLLGWAAMDFRTESLADLAAACGRSTSRREN